MCTQKSDILIDVKDLRVNIKVDSGILNAVRGVNFSIRRGETLGLVGESGCGKSITSKAILGINAKNVAATGEAIFYDDGCQPVALLKLKRDSKEIRAIRGGRISMIFQEPMTAFSPLYTIGNQLIEMIRLHRTRDKKQARELAIQMLEKVGIANPEKRIDQYPHEFSGGMLQRALIAMALSCNPAMLIADEPTTALDVTIQAQILELMKALQQEFHMAILFITHDLGTVAAMCDNVAVMYLGEIVEYGPVREIFHSPQHPYTIGLLRSVPKTGGEAKARLASIEGSVPVPTNLPETCGFYDRCPMRLEGKCLAGPAAVREVGEGHYVRCMLTEEELKAGAQYE